MELMYPKSTGRKKKRRTCTNSSIMHVKDGTCYLCVLLNDDYKVHPFLHKHHVIPGNGRRQRSEEFGLYVWLCPFHHEFSLESVHLNKDIMNMMKRRGQRAFEYEHGSRDEFVSIFGKNYL